MEGPNNTPALKSGKACPLPAAGISAGVSPCGVWSRKEKTEGPMLNLELVRGPLSDQDYRTILAEYTRLTKSRDSERLMHRWCKDSPAGPALHSLLRTDESKIVGHACVFPFPMEVAGKIVTAGKTEYLFVHENFRREAVRGMEARQSRTSILMLQQLFRHVHEQLRWDPILASTLPEVEGVCKAVGFRTAMFPLFECLLIRRPWNACRFTPNLSRAKRLALLFVGLPQACLWAVVRLLLSPLGRNLKPLGVDAGCPSPAEPEKAHFSWDPSYLSWRYPTEGFQRFGLANRPDESVIAQKGSPHTYVRVCQSNVGTEDFPVLSLIVGLMGQARSCRALGVRWAIYGNGRLPAVVTKLKRLGFACVRRQRKIMIYTRQEELTDPSSWSFDDSLVSFENH
jgi:hypothetical protein